MYTHTHNSFTFFQRHHSGDAFFFWPPVANFWFIVFDERRRYSNLWQQLLQLWFFIQRSFFIYITQVLNLENKYVVAYGTENRWLRRNAATWIQLSTVFYLFIYLLFYFFSLSSSDDDDDDLPGTSVSSLDANDVFADAELYGIFCCCFVSSLHPFFWGGGLFVFARLPSVFFVELWSAVFFLNLKPRPIYFSKAELPFPTSVWLKILSTVPGVRRSKIPGIFFFFSRPPQFGLPST